MRLLALETANEKCSVAIFDGEQPLFFQQHHEPRAQTQQILPMVEQALAETHSTWNDFSVIAFSRGPGAFSGGLESSTFWLATKGVKHLHHPGAPLLSCCCC